MSPHDTKDRICRILAPLLGTALTIAICVERMALYAEALNEPLQESPPTEELLELNEQSRKREIELKPTSNKPSEQLGVVDPNSFKHIKTREQACRIFDKKLIAYYDQTGLVQGCRLRLITDPLMLNIVKTQNANKIIELPSSVYRLFPHGKPIRESEVAGFERSLGFKIRGSLCQALNDQYVTATGVNFYYVEGCRKRKFPNYAALQEHNQSKRTVKTITPGQLKKLKNGRDMKGLSGGVADIWITIDGDAAWQRSSRVPASAAAQQDNPEDFREAAKSIAKPVNKRKLCTEIKGKLVSFYGHIYYVENPRCQLRKLSDTSLDLQVVIEENRGLRDLTSQEKRKLKEGKPITSKAALKLLR